MTQRPWLSSQPLAQDPPGSPPGGLLRCDVPVLSVRELLRRATVASFCPRTSSMRESQSSNLEHITAEFMISTSLVLLAIKRHLSYLELPTQTGGHSQPKHQGIGAGIADRGPCESHPRLAMAETCTNRSPSTTGKPRKVNARTITRISFPVFSQDTTP